MLIEIRAILLFMRIRFKLKMVLKRLGFGSFERAIKLRSCLWKTLKYQLIRLIDSSSHDLSDPNFEKIIDLATMRLMFPDYFDTDLRHTLYKDANHIVPSDNELQRIQLQYHNRKIEVDAVVNSYHKSSSIKSILAKNFQVQMFLNDHFGNNHAHNVFMELAKQYDSQILELDSKSITTMLRTTRKDLRSLKESASNKQAIKISFSSEYIATIVSISSALFFVSGYLYNRSILGHFGVDVRDYFSLSDYVAASVEGIRHSLIATVFAILGGFIGIHDQSRLSYRQLMGTASAYRRAYFLMVLFACCATIYAYLARPETFYFDLAFVIMVVSPKSLIWIVRRYIAEKSRRSFYFALQSFLIFFLYLYASINTEIYKIEHNCLDEVKRYDILLKTPVEFGLDHTIVFASNSRYIFLRHASDGKIFILPTSEIRSISVRQQ